MSNKKRIRKLIQIKYKPSRQIVSFDRYKFAFEFEKAAGNAAKQLALMGKALTAIMAGVRLNTGRTWGKTDFINTINKEDLIKLQTTSRADFQREYMNYPIDPIEIDGTEEFRYISEKPPIAIPDLKYIFISSI